MLKLKTSKIALIKKVIGLKSIFNVNSLPIYLQITILNKRNKEKPSIYLAVIYL